MTRLSYCFYFLFFAIPIFPSCIGIESVDLTSRQTDVSVPSNETDSELSDSSSKAATIPGESDIQSDPVDTDMCPEDPDKLKPGVCDCGTPDLDSDDDGVMDCVDGCPHDPDKTEAGICDCGTPDVDSDDDGTMDCKDGCPFDDQKIAPGPCGCGVEANSCWECVQDEDCEATQLGCEQPICISGKCSARPAPRGTKCRDSIGDCDQAEYCDGIHHNCPAESGIEESCVPDKPVTIKSLGRTLTLTDIIINGRDTNVAYVRPKTTVVLQVKGHVADSETNCGSCWTQYYITLENTFTVCLGNGTDGWHFSVLHSFEAPEKPGIYFIQTKDSWQYDCSPQIAGLIPDSTLAVIRVE